MSENEIKLMSQGWVKIMFFVVYSLLLLLSIFVLYIFITERRRARRLRIMMLNYNSTTVKPSKQDSMTL